MDLTPAELLAGPRGRRLCLDAALRGGNHESAAVDALTAAVTQVAYDLDPGRGTSRILAGAGGGEYSQLHTSPEDVARLLNSLPLAEPHDGAVLSSLRSAVSPTARTSSSACRRFERRSAAWRLR